MPRQLTNLRIDEVSSVDKGAGQGVKVLLMKRQAEQQPEDVTHKALTLAIGSIMADGGKAEDFVECFKQFHSYLKGEQPKEPEMTADEINKLVAEAVAKAFEEAEKKKTTAKPGNAPTSAGTVGGKSPAPPQNNDNEDGDSAADDATKSLSDAAAKELLDKLGIKLEKKDEPKVEKADEIAKRDEKIVTLEKSLAELVEKDQKAEFAKRAVAIGLAESEGEHLRKAYLGDVKSLDFLSETIAKLHKQVEKAGLFGEVGSAGGAPADAHSALISKAADIAKSAAESGKPMTQAQAYVKALEVYPDLAKQEKAEREARLLKHA